jgi:hypothetical protein
MFPEGRRRQLRGSIDVGLVQGSAVSAIWKDGVPEYAYR